MSREVRRVPAQWQHPKNAQGDYFPLRDGYGDCLREFQEHVKSHGWAEALDYFGGGPVSDDYMPDWPAAERTHYQWYETVSEGTPLSPPCATLEELAQWLATHPRADPFSGRLDAPAWLRVLRQGGCFTMMLGPAGVESGAQYVARVTEGGDDEEEANAGGRTGSHDQGATGADPGGAAAGGRGAGGAG